MACSVFRFTNGHHSIQGIGRDNGQMGERRREVERERKAG